MTGRILACSNLSVLVCLIVFSGCGSRQAYDKRYYVLNVARRAESTPAEADSVLEVRRFTIDSAFGGKGLVYRTGEFEYESDFYNEFLVSPATMITDKVRNWLSESGVFKTVVDSGSQIDPTHVIEGNITALYGDFRDTSSAKATIELRIFLLRVEAGGNSIPVFGQTYQSAIGIESEGAEGLVKVFDKCLEDILSALERDLIETLD